MSDYTPTKSIFPVGLDELGLRMGLTRFQDESLSTFRNRLLLQARKPPGGSQDDFIFSLGRTVGVVDTPIWKIDLTVDSDGVPLAVAPKVEISASYLKIWSDDSGKPDVELDIYNRDGEYFLGNVYEEISDLDYISIETIDQDFATRLSRNLAVSSTSGFVYNEFLKPSRLNLLANLYVEEALFSASHLFNNQVDTLDDVAESGDYYIDESHGFVYSSDIARGTISYSYRKFPFTIYWQPVRAYSLRSVFDDGLCNTTLIDDDTGEEARLELRSAGAEIFNKVLRVHPQYWGK